MDIAVLIPCYNEEASIARVLSDVRAYLPQAKVYVCDNNSTDKTAEMAASLGAIVYHEEEKGKGNALRKLFRLVEADIYFLVDGDESCDLASAPMLLDTMIKKDLDMITVKRDLPDHYKRSHIIGNGLFSRFVSFLFKKKIEDVFSGYRVLSRRFVKTFPFRSSHFEIEAELTISACSLGIPFADVAAPFHERTKDTDSKLRTYHDGFKILRMIMRLFILYRPLAFFTWIFSMSWFVAFLLGVPIVMHFLQTHTVPRLPTVMLIVGLGIFGVLNIVLGFMLHVVNRHARDIRYFMYLRERHYR